MSTDAGVRDDVHEQDHQPARHAGAEADKRDPRVSFAARKDDESTHDSLHPPTPSARRALVHLLVGKSVLEALLVAALAVAFYAVAFKPSFRGALDLAHPRSVEGWVVDASRPASHVEVQLYIDGRFVASGLANEPRPDVRDAGRAPDELHGFRFRVNVTEPGEHEARVYAVHTSGGGTRRTLQQIGHALRFRVGER